MGRETQNPIHIAFSKATPTWIVCTPIQEGFGIGPLSIVSPCHVARHPEDRSRIDETSAYVFSNEVHSICFVRTDPYISWPPLGNQALAQNQTMTLLDDDMQLKRRNPTSEAIADPMIVFETLYTFS
jgi:hypothetical protein